MKLLGRHLDRSGRRMNAEFYQGSLLELSIADRQDGVKILQWWV